MLRHLRRATASHRTAAAGAAHCDTNRQLTHHKVQQRGIAPRPLGKARVATIARPTRYVSTSRSQSTSDCRRPSNDNVSAQVWRLVLKATHIDFDSKSTDSTSTFVQRTPDGAAACPRRFYQSRTRGVPAAPTDAPSDTRSNGRCPRPEPPRGVQIGQHAVQGGNGIGLGPP